LSDSPSESRGPHETDDGPLTGQLPFELCTEGKHLKRLSSCGGGRVDRLPENYKVDAQRLQLRSERDEVLEGPRQAIELRAHDHIDRAPAHGLQQRVQGGARGLGAARAGIHVLVNRPASLLTVRPKFLVGLSGRLLLGAESRERRLRPS